jgi:hypothetical protein
MYYKQDKKLSINKMKVDAELSEATKNRIQYNEYLLEMFKLSIKLSKVLIPAINLILPKLKISF